MKEEVKIVYCYDENKNPVHYLKTIKGEKYFCVDCGADLVCKDGSIKVKHLAHKYTENCGGTGESIFHKHWKENLFKAGMFFNIANRINDPISVEIIDVLNEVSLNKRYNKIWDREIIVDVLLITKEGEIVIEINYKNNKKWDELKPYYAEINLLRVYEVTVDKNVNTKLEWFCLGEDDEIKEIERKKIEKEEKKRVEKERLREEKNVEKARLKDLEFKKKEQDQIEKLKNGTYKKHRILFNYLSSINKIDEYNYSLKCISETDGYSPIRLNFNLQQIGITEKKLRKHFCTRYGIKYCSLVINTLSIENKSYEVIEYGDVYEEQYDKRLFAQICNAS